MDGTVRRPIRGALCARSEPECPSMHSTTGLDNQERPLAERLQEQTEEEGIQEQLGPRTRAARAGARSPYGPLTLMAASGQPVTHSMHPLQEYAKRGTIR